MTESVVSSLIKRSFEGSHGEDVRRVLYGVGKAEDPSFEELKLARGVVARDLILERARKDLGIDRLTTLTSNKGLKREMDRQRDLLARQKDNVLLIMYMDLDGFKTRVNDKYGHETGNKVLRSFGPILRNLIRKVDTGARDGGDEFAVLALVRPDSIEKYLQNFSERLELNLAAEKESVTAIGEIGVCLGWTTLDQTNSEISNASLLDRADIAMYYSKTKGKDIGKVTMTKWNPTMTSLPKNLPQRR